MATAAPLWVVLWGVLRIRFFVGMESFSKENARYGRQWSLIGKLRLAVERGKGSTVSDGVRL